jgi:hypothetical protein
MAGAPDEGGNRPEGGGTKPGDIFDAEDLKALQARWLPTLQSSDDRGPEDASSSRQLPCNRHAPPSVPALLMKLSSWVRRLSPAYSGKPASRSMTLERGGLAQSQGGWHLWDVAGRGDTPQLYTAHDLCRGYDSA